MARLLFTTLLLLGIAVAGAAELTPHEAEYKLKMSILGGKLNTRLVSDNGTFSANHVIRPTGLSKLAARGKIDETSDFSFDDDKLSPSRYRSVDQLTKDKTRADVSFDWDQHRMGGTIDGESVDQPIEDNLLDRVSVQYQLMRDLKSGELREQYSMFDIDEVKVLNVSQVGERRIKTPAGTYDATGVRHQSEGSSRSTTLWCVEELDFLPVLIEQHRKGKLKFEAKLKSYTTYAPQG